jgi:hypothetical protein
MKEIKDFIYLDMEKVSSLYSQLSGGMVQSVESSSATSEDSKNLRNYDFKLFKHEAGGTKAGSSVLKETRVSHHEIYNLLEQELFSNGYAAEIGVDISKENIDSGDAVKIFESALCIKAEGHIVLEDYERLTRIADNYDDIRKFINNSIQSNLKETPELKEFIANIDVKKEEIKKMKNGSSKIIKKNELNSAENELSEFMTSNQVSKVEDWIIEGLKTWVRVFLPDVFNVRLYPFDDSENFHVMSNVKRKFFLDDNTESVHYLFGSKPTIKVTMLGVITSIPQKEGESFEPMREFDNADLETEGNEAKSVEKGFRGVFRGFEGLEVMIRNCRYPRIMVQPIAIYRAIKPNKSLQRK